MKIYIKNMVCDRCNLVVTSLLKEMGIEPVSVELGQVDLGSNELTDPQLKELQQKLQTLGFELLDDKKAQLIEKIKTAIIALVHRQESLKKTRLSDHLKNHVNFDYNHISQLFSSVEGITIEQYFINQKVEKVKELLVYGELSATEIAYRLGYSSLAHLSGQFKKSTGMTPSQFRKIRDVTLRKPLDKV